MGRGSKVPPTLQPVRLSADGIRVAINPAVVDLMREFAALGLPNETGGCLYGRRLRRGADLEVLVVGCLPAPADSVCDVDYFERGTDGFEELWEPILKAGCGYLGEWHTHPRGVPFPSEQDYLALGSVVGNADYGAPTAALGLILGLPEHGWILGGFFCADGGARGVLSLEC